jgi:FkbM family methyltransferase
MRPVQAGRCIGLDAGAAVGHPITPAVIRRFRRIHNSEVRMQPYIVRNRHCMGETFDMTIVDEISGFWYGLHEDQNRPELTWCKTKLRPGQTAVDCGAHHGLVSILFSRWVGPAGQVFAYEAIKANAQNIAANLKLNGCENVTVRPVAVSNRRRWLPFKKHSGNAIVGTGWQRVQAVDLDSDIGDRAVHFLKIDVEGHELEAMAGARGILRQNPHVALELHNLHFVDKVARIEAILENFPLTEWKCEISPEVPDTPFEIQGPIDINWLAQFDNPHLYLSPV